MLLLNNPYLGFLPLKRWLNLLQSFCLDIRPVGMNHVPFTVFPVIHRSCFPTWHWLASWRGSIPMKSENCSIAIELHFRIRKFVFVRRNLFAKRFYEVAKCLDAIYSQLLTRCEVKPGNIICRDVDVSTCVRLGP